MKTKLANPNGLTPTGKSDTVPRFFSVQLDSLIKKYATPLTASLSLVVGLSGSMMFFHLYKGKVQPMHEWLGMAFLFAFLLHVARNRRPFAALFGQAKTYLLLGASAFVALSFLILTPPAKSGPGKGLAPALLRAPIASLAPALGLSLDDALARVKAATGAEVSADSTLEGVAKSTHTDAIQLLNAVLGSEQKMEKKRT